MDKHQAFFQQDVPQLLNELQVDTKPLWGEMDSIKMIDHLRAGTELFLSKRKPKLEVPEEKLPRYKAFLMSDKPFMEGARKPKEYQDYERQDAQELDKLKSDFLEVLKRFDSITLAQKDFWCFHPSFGLLDPTETRQLQFKHIRHHFQQFGLMER